jgi:hypothetical protein
LCHVDLHLFLIRHVVYRELWSLSLSLSRLLLCWCWLFFSPGILIGPTSRIVRIVKLPFSAGTVGLDDAVVLENWTLDFWLRCCPIGADCAFTLLPLPFVFFEDLRNYSS